MRNRRATLGVGLTWKRHNDIIVSMVPPFDNRGNVPPGIHWASWSEIRGRFGNNTHRQALLEGLKRALVALKKAGCKTVYLNGSFITSTLYPADFDGCWDLDGVDPALLDPILLDFRHPRRA